MSVSVDSVASFVAARSNVEAGQAVAARINQIEGQIAGDLMQSLDASRATLANAVEQIAVPPPLDGTGKKVDRSV